MAEIKTGTHYIAKVTDVVKYLSMEEIYNFVDALIKIRKGRYREGEKQNEYYICNTDEPYADEVLKVILNGEDKKECKIKIESIMDM